MERSPLLSKRGLFIAQTILVSLLIPAFSYAKTIIKQKAVVRHTRAALTFLASSDPKKAPTRCLGDGIRNLYDASMRQMNKDIAKAGDGRDEAVKTYRGNLDLVWQAMNQPYCGYGTRGLSAVRHSFDKTITRTRTEFLNAIKTPAPVPSS